MIDQIVGAYNMNKELSFRQRTETIATSIFDANEKSSLISDNALILIASNKGICGLLKDNIFITYLGQIYGYLVPVPENFRNNKFHTLWYLYKYYGNCFGKYINGHFIIILLDKNLDQFFLIQDKFPGIKTLYYVIKDKILYFSNYIKPLLCICPECKVKINKKALYQYLKCTYISAPDTIFEGIKQVLGGEIVNVKNSTISTFIYDPWEFPSERIADEDGALEEYNNLLNESIKNFLSWDSSCGFLLSGGFDSSINVALGAKQVSEQLITIGTGAKNYNTDAPYARKVSKLFNTRHYEYLFDGTEINGLPQIVWQMENPNYEPGIILSYATLRHAKNYVSNVIGGDAADQIFGSCAQSAYARFKINNITFGLFNIFQRLLGDVCKNIFTEGNVFFRKIENKLIGKFNVNNWCGVYGFRDCDIKALLRENYYFEEKFNNIEVPDNDPYSLFDFGCTALNRDYALNGILEKTGRMGDFFCMKIFSPYIDKNVFNFIMSLDYSLRDYTSLENSGEFISKYLHKQLANKMLPEEVTERPQQGGAIDPYIHFEDIGRSYAIKKTILKSDFLNGLFNRHEMEKLFANTQSNAVRIMLLLTLDLWNYIFRQSSIFSMPSFTLGEYLSSDI